VAKKNSMAKQKPFVRDSSVPLATTQFPTDATFVSNPIKQTPMYTNTEGGARFTSEDKTNYAKFKSTLPSNLSKGSDSEYAMDYAWEKSGKPKNFKEGLQKDMYTKESDGLYHGYSVEKSTGRFLKAKGHPSVQKELDWYNSKAGASFKKENIIDSSGKFYQYKAKKK
jgi:hypothetical protein